MLHIISFSEDGNYFFAENKLYHLDTESIITDFTDSTYFGGIPPFTAKEKERYFIVNDN